MKVINNLRYDHDITAQKRREKWEKKSQWWSTKHKFSIQMPLHLYTHWHSKFKDKCSVLWGDIKLWKLWPDATKIHQLISNHLFRDMGIFSDELFAFRKSHDNSQHWITWLRPSVATSWARIYPLAQAWRATHTCPDPRHGTVRGGWGLGGRYPLCDPVGLPGKEGLTLCTENPAGAPTRPPRNGLEENVSSLVVGAQPLVHPPLSRLKGDRLFIHQKGVSLGRSGLRSPASGRPFIRVITSSALITTQLNISRPTKAVKDGCICEIKITLVNQVFLSTTS